MNMTRTDEQPCVKLTVMVEGIPDSLEIVTLVPVTEFSRSSPHELCDTYLLPMIARIKEPR